MYKVSCFYIYTFPILLYYYLLYIEFVRWLFERNSEEKGWSVLFLFSFNFGSRPGVSIVRPDYACIPNSKLLFIGLSLEWMA